MTTAERVRILRKDLKLSQEEFGKRLGLSVASISMIEKGTARLTQRNINSICSEFNANLDWLINGQGDMYKERIESQEMIVLEFAEILQRYPAVFEMAKVASRHMTADDWARLNELLEKIGGV